MKRVLGIICSPRKMGNCEIFVKEISRNIPHDHRLYLLRLSDFSIKLCMGCYACLFRKGRCRQRDDLPTILDQMAMADGLIIASPTYFLGANASLKNLLDRCLTAYSYSDRLWGKPAVAVGIAGIEGKEGSTHYDIERFLRLLLLNIKGIKIVYGALPGEVMLKDKNRKIAASLGKSLFGKDIKEEGPECPVCGGKTFRFIKKDIVQCQLCSFSGKIVTKGATIDFEIEKKDHAIFLSNEEAVEHREWLIDMCRNYMKKKRELESVSEPYSKYGRWIKPETKNREPDEKNI